MVDLLWIHRLLFGQSLRFYGTAIFKSRFRANHPIYLPNNGGTTFMDFLQEKNHQTSESSHFNHLCWRIDYFLG